MKITYWSSHRKSANLSGISRYEEELMKSIGELRPDIEMKRIQRVNNLVLGSTVFSWFIRYRCRDADIVHATDQVLAPISYLLRPKKFIVTVHDLIPLLYPGVIKDMSFRIQWLLTPRALRRVDKIITNSQFTKNEVIRLAGVDSSKIDVVYPGVDHSRYFPVEKDAAKCYLNLDTDTKYILSVSPNVEHKRVDMLLDVIKEVRKDRKDVILIRVGYGKGPFSWNYSQDGVVTTGWVPESEMPILYNCADVFLHTSEYEGFGSPVLEAMSCGTPIVVSNKASIPEVVGPCESVINSNSDNLIKQFTNKVLSSLDKGVDWGVVEQSLNFPWEKTAIETIRVYEKVLEE